MSLSAINHKRLNCLNELTRNYNKATLLDKLIFWWQHSTYTLNDNQKWFTRSVTRISEESGISKRSVERYMSQFEKMGLIERRNVLLRKKNLYIRITEKLLALLGLSQKKEAEKEELQESKPKTSSLNLAHIGGNKNAILAVSNIRSKEQIVKTNSTISHTGIVNNSDELTKKPNTQAKTTETENSEYKIEKEIGERLTTRFKNYIKGVLNNLQSQHSVIFSNPDKVFAEVVFAVTHEDNQLKGITNPHHRMNIIAKLLREKRWKTPKGFYNHWDIGKLFKEREEVRARQEQARKLEEGVGDVPDSNQVDGSNPRYNHAQAVPDRALKQDKYANSALKRQLAHEISELKGDIQSETKYLEQARTWFEQKISGITEGFLESLEQKIAGLYEQLTGLQSRLNAT